MHVDLTLPGRRLDNVALSLSNLERDEDRCAEHDGSQGEVFRVVASDWGIPADNQPEFGLQSCP